MDRRNRRSSDPRTALHLFLESQLARLGARSLRVLDGAGEIIAGVGDDTYADEWLATWTRRVDGTSLVIAASGGRCSDEVTRGVGRLAHFRTL